jgi:hypothetical protein
LVPFSGPPFCATFRSTCSALVVALRRVSQHIAVANLCLGRASLCCPMAATGSVGNGAAHVAAEPGVCNRPMCPWCQLKVVPVMHRQPFALRLAYVEMCNRVELESEDPQQVSIGISMVNGAATNCLAELTEEQRKQAVLIWRFPAATTDPRAAGPAPGGDQAAGSGARGSGEEASVGTPRFW